MSPYGASAPFKFKRDKLAENPPISYGFGLDACTRTENLIVGLNFGEIDANPDAFVSTICGHFVMQ